MADPADWTEELSREPRRPKPESSPGIAQLTAALAGAQGEIQAAPKDSTNPHFGSRYADLAAVWGVCRGPLSRHQLAVLQLPTRDDDGHLILRTILSHVSGEWISSTLPIMADTSNRGVTAAQALGSAITYARRYALSAMVGVCADEDDDGNSAAAEAPTKKPPRKAPGKPPEQPSEEEVNHCREKLAEAEARLSKAFGDKADTFMEGLAQKMQLDKLTDGDLAQMTQAREQIKRQGTAWMDEQPDETQEPEGADDTEDASEDDDGAPSEQPETEQGEPDETPKQALIRLIQTLEEKAGITTAAHRTNSRKKHLGPEGAKRLVNASEAALAAYADHLGKKTGPDDEPAIDEAWAKLQEIVQAPEITAEEAAEILLKGQNMKLKPLLGQVATVEAMIATRRKAASA